MATVLINTLHGTNQTARYNVLNASAHNCANLDNCTSIVWTSSEIAMWGLISLLAIVGLLYGVLTIFGLA